MLNLTDRSPLGQKVAEHLSHTPMDSSTPDRNQPLGREAKDVCAPLPHVKLSNENGSFMGLGCGLKHPEGLSGLSRLDGEFSHVPESELSLSIPLKASVSLAEMPTTQPQSLDQLLGQNELGSLNYQFDHTAHVESKRFLDSSSPASAAEYRVALEGKMVQVSKKHPCKHCGKDSHCMHGAIFDLCHYALSPAVGWELANKKPPGGGSYFRETRSNDFSRSRSAGRSVTKFHISSPQAQLKASNDVQNAEYRKIIGLLPLTSDEVAYLKSRGYDQESIDESVLRGSIGHWPGGGRFDTGVYGIDTNGKAICHSGLFISAMRGDKILGGQIIPPSHILYALGRGPKPEIGKYLALGSKLAKSTLSPKTIDTKETPLTSQAEGTPENIYIVEGYFKSHILFDRLRRSGKTNFMVIGAAGSQWGVEELKVHIGLGNNPGAAIIFLPDGGAINNPGVSGGIARSIHGLSLEGYYIKIGWWGQLEKGGTDPDEISLATFDGMSQEYWEDSYFSGIIKARLDGFGLVQMPAAEVLAASDQVKLQSKLVKQVICSSSDELAALINEYGRNPEVRVILNTMHTGSGKSHAIASIDGRVVLCTNDPHNPGTPEIAQFFTKTPARSAERYLHPTELNGAGLPKNQSKDNGGEVIPATCVNTEEIKMKYPAGLEDSPCTDCSLAKNCDHLRALRSSISAPKQIMHPNSLPRPSKESTEALSDTFLILDDVSIISPKQVTISMRRVRAILDHVEQQEFLGEQIKEWYLALYKCCKLALGSKYGLDCQKVSKTLPDWNTIPINDRAYAQKYENDFSVEYEGQGVKVDTGRKVVGENGKIDFIPGENRAWEQNMISVVAEGYRAEAIVQAFSEGRIGSVMNAMFYSAETTFSFTADGDLVLSRQDERLLHAIHSAKLVVINDATGLTPEMCMRLLDLKADQIISVTSPPSANTNIDFTNVVGLPTYRKIDSGSINKSVIDIICAKAAELPPGSVCVIHPASIDPGDKQRLVDAGVICGTQFFDSRGSNIFMGCIYFFNLGNFKINRISASIAFAMIYKRHVDTSINPALHPDMEWRKFCLDLQVAEVIQFIGRGRAARRFGETLNFIQLAALSSDAIRQLRLKCPGVNFCSEHGCDFEGWIPSETQSNQIKLVHHLMTLDLIANRPNISQIAKDAGVTIDVARGFFERLGEKSGRQAKLLELQGSEMWHMNSIALGLPPVEIYDPSDLDCYISEPTKAAIKNDLDARANGMAHFFKVKSTLFGLATKILEPLDPDKFAQIFLGTPPPITEPPDWDVELSIDDTVDPLSAQSSDTSDPPID